MRLNDIDLDKITPEFMKNDAVVKALNKTLEDVVKSVANDMKRLPIWGNLQRLSDDELDAFAYEFDIPWYNNSYSKDKKITIIQNNVKLVKKLGTPATMQTIIEDIFGACVLQEAGIDYEGEPHHIKVLINQGESLTGVNYDRFMYMIGKVKRASSWIDDVYNVYLAEGNINNAMSVQDRTHEEILFDTNGYL